MDGPGHKTKPRLKLGRELVEFGDGKCQQGWKEEKRGKSRQNTLKTLMKLFKKTF